MPEIEYAFHVRWALNRDMAEILKIETETFGSWVLEDFLNVARKRRGVLMVCTVRKKTDTAEDEVVCGFMALEVGKYETKVLNFANTWPEARRLLMDKAFQRAAMHRTQLTWEES